MLRFVFFVGTLTIASCDKYAPCERYYIPKKYTGQIKVYYNQEKGERVLNRQGCIVHSISENGVCYSAWPYKKNGTIVEPGVTMRFFEVDGKDSTLEIYEFNKQSYLEDTAINKYRKYVSYYFGGIENGKPVAGCYIDYGINFMNRSH
jgi:hypothetical protein